MSMEHHPKISIITPSFNQGKFIADAIESVLVQNYPNFEHIIIDNCSTDDTVKILRRYRHLRWLSETDRGQSHALNKGIKMATGEWIVWLNADDLLAEGALRSYAQRITDDPSVDVMYGHVKYITESGQYLHIYSQIKFRYIFILFGVYGPPSSGTLFKKNILTTYSLSEDYHYAMDTEWFLRCGRIIKTRLVNQITSCFRISYSSKTSGMIAGNSFSEKHLEERQRYCRKYLFDRMTFIPDMMKNYIYRSVRFLLLGIYYVLKLRHIKYFMYTDQRPVVMFTTIHSANDHRIYYKEARSLAKKYSIIIVAPIRNKVSIADIPHKKISFIRYRLIRFIGNFRLIPVIYKLNPKILHIHDPELLPVALLAKMVTRSKTIYDVHENQHLDILQKEWLPIPVRKSILYLFKLLENIVLKRTNGLILAEDSYVEVYNNHMNMEIIRNYPLIKNVRVTETRKRINRDVVRLSYVGSVQRIRGIIEMLRVVSCLKHDYGKNVHLDVVGAFESSSLKAEAIQLINQLDIVDSVILHGILPHETAVTLLNETHIGFALYHPLPTHQKILPVKFYEYLLMKNPIVATDIDVWRDFIYKHKCGIVTNPFHADNTAKQIVDMYKKTDIIETMGENGFIAVTNEYNWNSQEKKLFSLYEKILRGVN